MQFLVVRFLAKFAYNRSPLPLEMADSVEATGRSPLLQKPQKPQKLQKLQNKGAVNGYIRID